VYLPEGNTQPGDCFWSLVACDYFLALAVHSAFIDEWGSVSNIYWLVRNVGGVAMPCMELTNDYSQWLQSMWHSLMSIVSVNWPHVVNIIVFIITPLQ